MVVHTTGETTTSGVLAVLAYTTVTGGDVAAVLASLREPCRHFLNNQRKKPYRSGYIREGTRRINCVVL